jgi:transposase-like protein
VKRKAKNVLPQNTKVRTSKYVNNLIEQDHRRVKQRIYPMPGFKNFAHAAVTISGIELAQKIRKGQFNTAGLTSEAGARVPQLWHRVLAA